MRKITCVMNFESTEKRNRKRQMKSTRQIKGVIPKMKKLQQVASSKSMPSVSNNGVSNRLQRKFFAKNSNSLAKSLLGKILCKVVDDSTTTRGEHSKDIEKNVILKARIVETEMYPGVTDPASHSYKGKKTTRNGAMFMDPGVCYVYNIYGMYQCKSNVSGKVFEKIGANIRPLPFQFSVLCKTI